MLIPDMVKGWLRLPPGDAGDDDLIAACTDATNEWVMGTAYVKELPDPHVWPADVILGATMLAARLYRRRNTPGGIEAIADGAVYVPRRDGDVDSMLHMHAWAPPRVG